MYQKLINYLASNQDKVWHFTAGMIVCLICSVFMPAWMACLIAVAAGVAKEIRDEISYGGFDWVDLAATVAGALFVFGCLICSLPSN
jgi:hypothetical protein